MSYLGSYSGSFFGGWFGLTADDEIVTGGGYFWDYKHHHKKDRVQEVLQQFDKTIDRLNDVVSEFSQKPNSDVYEEHAAIELNEIYKEHQAIQFFIRPYVDDRSIQLERLIEILQALIKERHQVQLLSEDEDIIAICYS